MQPEIQISLVIPAGSGVGPFDLYSNVDGYTTPFETGVDAASLTGSGYITTPPDGTTFIRVQSTGSCDTFIDLENPCQPTTTTTTSSSTSTTTSTSTSTSTTTTTSTTIAPTTTTTTSSSTSTTTTTTPPTTTTTTSVAPENCFCITVGVRDDLLEDGGQDLYYNLYPCGGDTLPQPINLRNAIGTPSGGSSYFGFCVDQLSELFKYGESGTLFDALEGMTVTDNGGSCSVNGDCPPVIP